ncbi:MAG: SDR family NAD(P)-dependent oxidoreductase [Acidimicrobiia bacterium]|nr:SDR family NAD(P)-dependent oxidoreductase [Acidimicrobiia bacterium]
MEDLQGRTAVVTGAASGMGLAFAEAFLREGMQVVAADVEVPALARAEGQLAAIRGPGAVLAVRTDVSDPASVAALRDAALARFGRVNVVCNNAGVGGVRNPIGRLDLSDWRWVLGVNLWGVIHGCEAFAPHLLEHGDGHIVNTASIAGHVSLPFMAPYNVSKHGVVTLSETLLHELAHAGSSVGVSVLCPGFVATNLIDADRNRPEHLVHPLSGPEDAAARERERAAGRELLAQKKPPAEVAQLVVDAVKANQFWIFTDEQFAPVVAERHRSIESATNPPKAKTLVDYLLA